MNLNPFNSFGGMNLGPQKERSISASQFGSSGGSTDIHDIKEFMGRIYVLGSTTSSSLFGVTNPRGTKQSYFVAVFRSENLKDRVLFYFTGGQANDSKRVVGSSMCIDTDGSIAVSRVQDRVDSSGAGVDIHIDKRSIDGAAIRDSSSTILGAPTWFLPPSGVSYLDGVGGVVMVDYAGYYIICVPAMTGSTYSVCITRITKSDWSVTTKTSVANAIWFGKGYAEKVTGETKIKFYGCKTGDYALLGWVTYDYVTNALASSFMSGKVGTPNIYPKWVVLPISDTDLFCPYEENGDDTKLGFALQAKSGWAISKQSLIADDADNTSDLAGKDWHYPMYPSVLRRISATQVICIGHSKSANFGCGGKATQSGMINIAEIGASAITISKRKLYQSSTGNDYAKAVSSPVNNLASVDGTYDFAPNDIIVGGTTTGNMFSDKLGTTDSWIARQNVGLAL